MILGASADSAASPRWLSVGLRIAGGLVVVVYLAWLFTQISPHAGGSDPSGYLNSARLFSEGRITATARELPGKPSGGYGAHATMPLGFLVLAPGTLVPTYPAGYPLELLAGSLLGWRLAPKAVSLVLVVASGWLLMLFCRRLGLSRPAAVGAALVLGACPLFLYGALLPMSDLSAMVWTLAALLVSFEAPNSWRKAVACGAFTGFAVLVRPTNVLFFLPLLVAVRGNWRAWAGIVAGGLPFGVFFLLFNWRAYGSPLATGYGDVTVEFGTRYLLSNLRAFGQWLPALLSPLVALAVLAPFTRIGRRREFLAAGTWAVGLIALYAFYSHSGETWWYLRFLLPVFPVLIVAAFAVGDEAGRRSPGPVWGKTVAGIAAMGFVLWSQIGQVRDLDVLSIEPGERAYPEAARWAKQNLPPGAAIFCMQVSGAFFFYTDFTLCRWDLVAPEKLPELRRALHERARPIYAVLFDFEKDPALQRLGGEWHQLVRLGEVTVWQQVEQPSS